MPTDLQIEAAKMLNDNRKFDASTRRISGGAGLLIGLLGGGPVAIPFFLASELMRWNRKKYYAELEEVVRGERSTLPTPPAPAKFVR